MINPIVKYMSKKLLVTPMPLVMHTKFKFQTKRDAQAMSRVVRALVTGYLNGEFDVSPYLDRDPTPHPGRRPASQEGELGDPDFYDALYEKISEAADA